MSNTFASTCRNFFFFFASIHSLKSLSVHSWLLAVSRNELFIFFSFTRRQTNVLNSIRSTRRLTQTDCKKERKRVTWNFFEKFLSIMRREEKCEFFARTVRVRDTTKSDSIACVSLRARKKGKEERIESSEAGNCFAKRFSHVERLSQHKFMS
jgi:hypothetical protein